jgi:hypothetical protein
MRKIAILIGAYENPDYLDALVNKMIHPRVNIYIHINKYNYNDFVDMFSRYENHPSVHMYSECAVKWGGHSLIMSQFYLVKKALQDDENYYFHFITGADILVRPIEELIEFCDNNNQKNFLQVWNVTDKYWSLRYLCYNFYDIFDVRSNKFNFYLVKGIARLQYTMHLWRKKWPFKELKRGSGWWSLNRDALEYLYSSLMSKDIKKLWMYTHAPDETIYQCILYNSAFKDSLTGDNLCYLRWTGQPSPKTLTMDDWGDIQKSKQFFARKVHPIQSKELINTVFSII